MSKWDDLKTAMENEKWENARKAKIALSIQKGLIKSAKKTPNEYAQDYAEISKRNIQIAKYDADTEKYIFIPFTDVLPQPEAPVSSAHVAEPTPEPTVSIHRLWQK